MKIYYIEEVLTRKIKILNIITRLELGGPPILILDILQRLNKGHFESAIATGLAHSRKRDMIEFAKEKGFKVYTIPTLVRNICPHKDFISLIKLSLLIKKEGYDIIHCHTSKGGFIGRLAARLAGSKVIIYSPHGDIFEGYFSRLTTKAFVLLEKFAAQFTDKIITLSIRGKKRFLEQGIGEERRIKHIYNGIDFKKFTRTEDKRGEFGLRKDDFVCATIGRLVPVKGHSCLLKAIRRVVQVIPQAKFLFVGDGPQRQRLEQEIIVLELENNVSLLGARTDIAEILFCIDLFLLPSINEGFGIVLVEAMAMGKPIVATNVGGIPEIVKDGTTGILVSPKDDEALSSSIIKLHKNPGLALKMGQAGYRRAKRLFDIESTVLKYEELYLELARKKGVIK
ncbi:MAG: glycosyltransferase family 1 protein [Candidatus Scalindua sp. SCAELEC01]|nr:GT4 family glycosyltransferase PelF [Planctomycetota bacterium]RZV84950.1 MAG: glycosyltransferase family 1 protein [Candidatus Scalindua sp. SCAELEC01]